jgi:hypothetical protein
MSNSTLDRLEELQAEATPISPFRPDFEDLIVPFLLDFPQFVEVGLLKAEYFTKLTTHWVMAEILNYHEKYSVVPSRDTLRDVLERKVTEDDPYEEIFKLTSKKSDPRNIRWWVSSVAKCQIPWAFVQVAPQNPRENRGWQRC